MSDNNTPPKDAERRIRELRDNDAFCDQIWSYFSAYQEIRRLEINSPDLPDEKDCIDGILHSLEKYTQAVNVASRYGHSSWSKIDNNVEEIRDYWSAVRSGLDNRSGRKTKQESLSWLVKVLLDTFNTWAVPEKYLTGFIEKVLAVILPDGTSPSRSSIQNAKKEHCS